MIPFILAFALTLGLLGRVPGESDKPNSAVISVRLSVPKTQYQLSEPIPVRVTIENQGSRPILIGRAIWTGGSRLSVMLEDPAGGRGWGEAGSVGLEGNPNQTLEEAVCAHWLLLYPGSFYGATLTMTEKSNELLKTPGRYWLKAEYSSQAIKDALRELNPQFAHYDEIAKLPYRAFEGKVEVEPVAIEILPPRQAPRERK